MGYDLYLFEDRQRAEKFLCAVCQGVAKDVFETDCGHIFCRSCVGKLIRVNADHNNESSAQCPHCRASVAWQNVHSSKFLNREISHLHCKCNLCSEWVGEVTKLNEHQLNECPDGYVDCVWKKYGCKESIRRKDVESHNEEFKVQHLEMKINCLQNQHQTQIATLKRKYEQQINKLKQDNADSEKRWKQKVLLIHKKYGAQNSGTPGRGGMDHNNSNININHIENITISSTNTSNSITATPSTALPSTSKHNRSGLHSLSYHENSDGSITHDPTSITNLTGSPLQSQQRGSHPSDAVRSQSRGRRKRPRSVLDEFGSASDLNDAHNGQSPVIGMDLDSVQHHNTNSSGGSGTATASKRKKLKRRRKASEGGGMLDSISRNGSGSRSMSVRKKKSKASTRKNKVRKRRKSQVLSDEEYDHQEDYGSEEPFHDSDQY